MKKLLILVLVFLLLLSGCHAPAEAPEVPQPSAEEKPAESPAETPEEPDENDFVFTRENLPILDGSTSMVPLGQAVAAALLGESREQTSDLVEFHRTTESFRYLMRGESDLLLVAEPNQVVFEEMDAQGFAYEMQPIAKEALVFIVNSNNPIDSLTVEQLQAIYTGSITNWSQVGGDDVEIVAFQRNATSGSQVLMDKLVMGDLEMMEAPQEWIPGEMDTLMAGVKGYEDSAAAIGYSVYYYAEDMRMAEGMKILSIEGVEPTDSTIADSSYPLINYYFSVIDAEAAADSPTRILYNWLVSADGQMLLESQGYVPAGVSAEETAVYMDTSKLAEFAQPREIFTRRTQEWVEDLVPGDYGLLRPYIGSRAAFDMTIYGSSGIYNGYKGLIDETGAIVVDPVYTDVSVLYDWGTDIVLPMYRLSKEGWIDSEWGGYMGQTYGFCNLKGTVVQPCIYEQVSVSNGYIVALERAEDGLFQIFDSSGRLLLDSADWPQRPEIYMESGMGTVDVSEHLLAITVPLDQENWDVGRWLYDWNGNLISAAYDYIMLGGEPPYICGSWDHKTKAYLDDNGEPMTIWGGVEIDYDIGEHAVATVNGVRQVIDRDGKTLWIPPAGEFSAYQSGDCMYYKLHPVSGDKAADYYDSSFRKLYPEADYVQHLYGAYFLCWSGNVCTITDGRRTAVLEQAPGAYEYSYHCYDNGSESLILINGYRAEDQCFWLFDTNLTLLSHGTLKDETVELLTDRLTGQSVAVQRDAYVYPYVYHTLDYPGAPKLENVKVLGVYGDWYMVEDEFTAGYMDADGNWLFRVSLMTDMTD